jgi:hypothetical protein
MDIREIGWEGLDRIHLGQNAGSSEHSNEPPVS